MRKINCEEVINKLECTISRYEDKIRKNEEDIKKLKKSVNEIKGKESEGSIWRPRYGEDYWFISTDECKVYKTYWRNFDTHEKRFKMGNVYETQEEAEFQLEKMNVLGELKKFSYKYRKGELNYYIYLNSNTNELGIVLSDIYMRFDFYFESYEKANEAIEVVGEDRIKKYLFEVE